MSLYYILLDGREIHVPGRQELTLLEPELTLEAGRAGSLSFVLPPGHLYYDKVKLLSSTVIVGEDWVNEDDPEVEPDPEDEVEPDGESDPGGSEVDPEQMFSGFWVGRPVEITTDFYGRRHVYCEGALAFLNDTVQTPGDFGGVVSTRTVFQSLLAAHNNQADQSRRLQLGAIQVAGVDTLHRREKTYQSTMEALRALCVDPCGGYLHATVRNRYLVLDWLALEDAHTSGQEVAYGLNLMDLEQRIDGRDVVTQVFPLGAEDSGGNPITVVSVNAGSYVIASATAVARYGEITRVVEFSDCTTPAELKTAAQSWLAAQQWDGLTIEADAADLHTLLPAAPPFRLGQRVRVVSAPHALDRTMPITKIVIRMDTLEKRITLGTAGADLTQMGSGGGGSIISGGSGGGGSYLPTSGGTVTGDLTVTGNLTAGGVQVRPTSQCYLSTGQWKTVRIPAGWDICILYAYTMSMSVKAGWMVTYWDTTATISPFFGSVASGFSILKNSGTDWFSVGNNVTGEVVVLMAVCGTFED